MQVETVSELSVGDVPAVDARSELGTSVGKAMALLSAFDRPTPMGVSELARKTELPKSTAFRLLAILEQWQLVERVASGYRLGTRLFELGNRVAYCGPRSLREVAHPFLEELYEITHETVHLAIVEGVDALYIDKIFGHNHVRSPSHVGGRIPAHCSALGKVLIAHGEPSLEERVLAAPLAPMTPYTITQPDLLRAELAEIRRTGVAFDREEASVGLTCVAAPVRNRRGATVAAISISGATSRFDPARHVDVIRRTASAVGDRLFT